MDGLERIAARALGRRTATWLEPACGTGRYLEALAKRGHRVIGFDRDPGMVGYAARRLRPWGTAARVLDADMTEFAAKVGTGTVDVAFNPINTVRHLASDRDMLRHFREIRRVLRPGGVYAVGLSLSWYGNEVPSEDVWEGARAGVRVKQVVQYIPPRSRASRREWVHSHLEIRRGRESEHRDSSYWLRCYGRRQWGSLVDRGGMRVAAIVNERGDEIEPVVFGYGIYLLEPATRSRSSG